MYHHGDIQGLEAMHICHKCVGECFLSADRLLLVGDDPCTGSAHIQG